MSETEIVELAVNAGKSPEFGKTFAETLGDDASKTFAKNIDKSSTGAFDEVLGQLGKGGAGDVASDDAKGLGENGKVLANPTAKDALEEHVEAEVKEKGNAAGLEAAADAMTTAAGKKFFGKASEMSEDPESAKKITDAVNDTEKNKSLSEILKAKAPTLLIAGLSIAGIGIWFAVTGTSPGDIIKDFTDPLADVAKQFIGALNAVGQSFTKPIGQGLKIIGIILGIAIAIVVVVVGITQGIKAAKAAKEKEL